MSFKLSLKTGTAVIMLAVLAAFVHHPSQAETVMVSTLAGGENMHGYSCGFADGLGSAAQFDEPAGIAIDAAGNLYVVDTENIRIRKVSPKGEVSTLAGGEYGFADGAGQNARFFEPTGITIDAAGNLYVADSFNHRIRKVTPAGVVSTLAGSEPGFADGAGSAARFDGPTGIAIDRAGNLYVADTLSNRIRKLTQKGEVSTLAGGKYGFADGVGSAAQFAYPSGIAIDAAGNLYVADTQNHRIRKVTPRGVVSTLAGNDKQGFADGKGKNARFSSPWGIAIDAAGNLYVADMLNHRIRKVTPEGEVSTLAGGGETDTDGGDFADGKGNKARFNWPIGITIDAAGNLYVADNHNCRIRKITLQRP